MSSRHREHWRYKNLTIVFIGVVLAIILSKNEMFRSFLLHLGSFGYVGAFGLIAGFGAVVGDMLIFNLIKDDLANEIEDLYEQIDTKKHLVKLFHTKYFNWMLPVIGAIIIASPLPDEMGISLINLSKISSFKFIILSYLLNSIGIFLIVSASVVIKP